MSDIRMRLEAHAAACRDAMDRGADRPALPDDLRDLSVANLSGANLGGANLSGADLRGADLRRANLRESNLGEANLSGANLREADLSGANLSGADLREADLRGTRVRVWIGGNYDAYTVPSNNGQLLAFGCERHTLDVWERDVAVLCKKHVRDHAERYEAEIRALIALCRVVEKEPKQ